MVARKDRENRAVGLVLLDGDIQQFQELLVDDGPFRQIFMENVTKKDLYNCFVSVQSSKKILQTWLNV